MGLPKRMPRSRPVSQSGEEGKRIIVNRYQVEKKLGSGNFGTAFLVHDLKCRDPTDEWKVLKEVHVGSLQPDETVDAMHEARLLARLDNPFIVKFHDSFLDGEFFCIVTEYCEGGDVDEYINKMKKSGQVIDESHVLDWIVQLLMAVHYMHSMKVLHRDLKTRNIFLRKNVVKVGDFGISRILMGTADMASTFTGTPYYMSPEVLKHEGYNSKSDIWSVGCVLYELCAQKHAFHGESLMGVMYKIVEGATPLLPEGTYSSTINELLTAMLTKDPSVRPSAADILRFEFVAKHKEKMRAKLEEMRSLRQVGGTAAGGGDDELGAGAAAAAATESPPRPTVAAPDEADSLAPRAARGAVKSGGSPQQPKNLNPRERMRLRKQQEADRKAQLLREEALRNREANLERKAAIRASLQHVSEAPWEKVREGARERDAASATVVTRKSDGGIATRSLSSTAPSGEAGASSRAPLRQPQLHVSLDRSEFLRHDDSETDEAADEVSPVTHAFGSVSVATVRAQPTSQISGLKSMPPVKVLSAALLDNRPVTPLKDKMVYDVKHSSLDFEDGVPDDPMQANTYYSQFDVEFDDTSDAALSDSGSDDDVGEKTLQQTQIDPGEMEQLAELAEQFDSNIGEGSITLNDDSVAGAFGPTARSIKIKNLRAECERKLGVATFKKVYDYLKEVRYERDGCLSTCDEDDMMAELAKHVQQRSDCFLVDQLLFLEMQARVDKC